MQRCHIPWLIPCDIQSFPNNMEWIPRLFQTVPNIWTYFPFWHENTALPSFISSFITFPSVILLLKQKVPKISISHMISLIAPLAFPSRQKWHSILLFWNRKAVLTLEMMWGSLHLASFPANSCTPKLAKTSINVSKRIETCKDEVRLVKLSCCRVEKGDQIFQWNAGRIILLHKPGDKAFITCIFRFLSSNQVLRYY